MLQNDIEYKRVSPKAKNVMRATSLILGIILTVVSIVIVLILIAVEVIQVGGVVCFLVPILTFALCLVNLIVTPIIRYKRYRYYIDDDMLVVVEGLWFITKSIAPMERIHQIEVSRGPIDRIFGMSNVSVTTAGGEITIAFLEDEVAEQISDRLKTRINLIAKKEKAESEAQNGTE